MCFVGSRLLSMDLPRFLNFLNIYIFKNQLTQAEVLSNLALDLKWV